jgi:putative lipase involved disintegration of autophagic bodies
MGSGAGILIRSFDDMMLPTALLVWLNPLLAYWTEVHHTLDDPPSLDRSLTFDLRHVHAVSASSRVLFADVPATHVTATDGDGTHRDSYTVRTRTVKSYRPPSSFMWSERRRFEQSMALHWEEDEVPGPDVESRDTLMQLAKMAGNAYIHPNETGWYNLENWRPVGQPLLPLCCKTEPR